MAQTGWIVVVTVLGGTFILPLLAQLFSRKPKAALNTAPFSWVVVLLVALVLNWYDSAVKILSLFGL